MLELEFQFLFGLIPELDVGGLDGACAMVHIRSGDWVGYRSERG